VLKTITKDQSGAAMVITGLTMFSIFSVVGAAIDFTRAYQLQSRMSYALDAAGLAAATVVNTEDAHTEAKKYYFANIEKTMYSANVTDPAIALAQNNTVLTLSSDASMPTSFLKLIGIDTLEVSAVSEITRAAKGMELIMVLDVTGSMDSGNKIGALRDASQLMINNLFGSDTESDTLWVGIVPYTTPVNIGDKTSWLKNYDPAALYPAGYPSNKDKWRGCVMARSGGEDVTDNVPDPTKPNTMFEAYYWPDDDSQNNDWINGSTFTVKDAQSDKNGSRGPNTGCPDIEVMPMTNQKQAIITKLQSLKAWYRGGTMSNEGIAWGWRMISPKWKGYWNHGHADLPLPYNHDLMEKVVILLTDGENKFYNDVNDNDVTKSDFTAWNKIQSNVINVNPVQKDPEGRRKLNDKTLETCTKMKEQGVIIYTITFQLNGTNTASTEARQMFQACASKPEYYFNSPSNAALQDTFAAIGDSLGNLRVSK
jgi:Flp pilus assembly protein TadG